VGEISPLSFFKLTNNMNVNRVTRKLRIAPADSVRFQLITSLVFFKKETLTPSELDILTHLALAGESELGSFCTETTKKMYVIEKMEEFSVKSQNIRNIINKLHKRGFIDKSTGKGKKSIMIHPDIELQCKGNVLLDYNFLSVNEAT
jgi:DNA-binding MarR family transcriptional regulator